MKPLLRYTLAMLLFVASQAASAQLTVPADGGNKKASISEQIGITDVVITYSRPGVKGREGQVYGTNVAHFGFKDLGFGTSKAAPWRAGANENTTIAFSTDVKIEGKDLAAGKYGLFMALENGAATVIFSKNSNSWGSYFYDPAEDALRVSVKTAALSESTERLTYEFGGQTENSAVVALVWEKLKVPFRIETDLVTTQLASFRNELRTDKGFEWQAWTQAANFCADRNTNLPEALSWANTAIGGTFVGQKNFNTLRTKARILELTGQSAEATTLMKEALPMGNLTEIHQYARELVAMKKPKEALAVFQMNAKKHPAEFTTSMGMVRGYSATGDYKNALKFAKAALPKAPDANNKANVENMIKTLEQGKDVN
jgi:tetratricopeptide (TPR) repeat protein